MVATNVAADTVLALDTEALIPLLGAGRLRLDEAGHLLVTGTSYRRQAWVLAVGLVAAVAGGFLLALMWQGERWPVSLVGATLILGFVSIAMWRMPRSKAMHERRFAPKAIKGLSQIEQPLWKGWLMALAWLGSHASLYSCCGRREMPRTWPCWVSACLRARA